MPDILELHEFFVEGNNQRRSHVLLHITEPGTPEEKAKGYFFALAEINNGPIEQIEHLQQMIDDLESGYYETDDQPGKNAFEITLEYINRRGHHILEFKDAVVNCLVGVLRNHSIFLACHGKPEARLFYHNKEQIEQINILSDSATPTGQLFSSVLEGQLNSGDLMYLASPHVIDYFTPDRITKIIQTRNLRQSAEHIQKVLSDLASELSFGGIIFRFPTNEDVPKTGKNPLRIDNSGSAASLDKLADQEKNTKMMMDPSLFQGLKNRFAVYQQRRDQTAKKRDVAKVYTERKKQMITSEKGRIETNIRPRETKKDPITNTILISIGKIIVFVGASMWKLVKILAITTAHWTVGLVILITNIGNQRQEIIRHWRLWWYDKKEKFSALPLISRILFTLTLILATIFISSVITYKIRASMKTERAVYNNKVQAITDKKGVADASLIYGDENRAATLMTEAQDILNTLPTNNKTRQKQKNDLAKTLDETWQKLQKLTVVIPELMFDLTQTNPNAKAVNLIDIDDSLITYGPDDKNFYKLSLSNKTIESKTYEGIGKLQAAVTPKENDLIIFSVNEKEIAVYSKDSSSILNKTINFEKDNVKIGALAIYNRKLYILDTANNAIYKHSPTQTGYDRGASWLKQEIDLNNSVSLAVDGDLYLLKTTGEITKLTAGEKQDFVLGNINPKLDKPILLRTGSSMNNIYILEPTNKRVVVIDKTGKLIAQYTANEWKAPSGMIVDEIGKKIFVLDENRVYKFGL